MESEASQRIEVGRDVVAIVMRRPTGEFFIHQRTSTRKTHPNLYGLGAGGKINPGETPEVAARRELLEETGIDAEPQKLFAFEFKGDTKPYYVHVFQVVTDRDVNPDESEWQWSGWVESTRVEELASRGTLCPDTDEFYRHYYQVSGLKL